MVVPESSSPFWFGELETSFIIHFPSVCDITLVHALSIICDFCSFVKIRLSYDPLTTLIFEYWIICILPALNGKDQVEKYSF